MNLINHTSSYANLNARNRERLQNFQLNASVTPGNPQLGLSVQRPECEGGDVNVNAANGPQGPSLSAQTETRAPRAAFMANYAC